MGTGYIGVKSTVDTVGRNKKGDRRIHLRSVKGKRSSVQDSWLKEAHEMPL